MARNGCSSTFTSNQIRPVHLHRMKASNIHACCSATSVAYRLRTASPSAIDLGRAHSCLVRNGQWADKEPGFAMMRSNDASHHCASGHAYLRMVGQQARCAKAEYAMDNLLDNDRYRRRRLLCSVWLVGTFQSKALTYDLDCLPS